MTTTETPAPAGDGLPPYSGPLTTCPKCSHGEAYTKHRDAVPRGVWGRDEDAKLVMGPLPERLERCCERCDWKWDESLCPPGCGMTIEALAHAIDNATPYPTELSTIECKMIAAYLLSCLYVSARPDHPLWQYDDGRPGPGPGPEPQPAPDGDDDTPALPADGARP